MVRSALLKFDLFRLVLLATDIVVMVLSMMLAYGLVFNGDTPVEFQLQFPYTIGIAIGSTLAAFAFVGVYSRRIPQITERDAFWIVAGCLAAAVSSYWLEFLMPPQLWPYLLTFWFFVFLVRAGAGVYSSYRAYFFPVWQLVLVPVLAACCGVLLLRLRAPEFLVPSSGLPVSRTIHALYFFTSLAGFLSTRWFVQVLYARRKRLRGSQARAIVVGADIDLLLFSRLNQISGGYRIVALLDNDPLRWGMWIQDARVVGGTALLRESAESLHADTVLLFRDALTASETEQVERVCRAAGLRLVRLGNLHESLLRGDSLSTADLLERHEYRYVPGLDENYLKGRRVMVTGAGGSIGSELVRQILRCAPEQVVLLGRGENSIFELERELQAQGLLEHTCSVIVNVVDREGLDETFAKQRPQVVFHAAAHKHVPLMETNVREAVRNNVLGTQHVMDLAGAHGVERVVMVSTDKAVSPSSVMGATKAKAEQVVAQCAREYPQTAYSVVRFGNVLGSRGSVVRLFLEQIRRGGPVTVTDPRMTRYFMTIPEAVSLVLATGNLGHGFGIYVLDMGKPYHIVDLAEKMIRMCGMEPGRDIRVEFTGSRPGEKLEEALNSPEERLATTSNPQVRRLESRRNPLEAETPVDVMELSRVLASGETEIRKWLFDS